jgi:hypothetical protein
MITVSEFIISVDKVAKLLGRITYYLKRELIIKKYRPTHCKALSTY